jgi:hypothetical protein
MLDEQQDITVGDRVRLRDGRMAAQGRRRHRADGCAPPSGSHKTGKSRLQAGGEKPLSPVRWRYRAWIATGVIARPVGGMAVA